MLSKPVKKMGEKEDAGTSFSGILRKVIEFLRKTDRTKPFKPKELFVVITKWKHAKNGQKTTNKTWSSY